MATYYVRTDGSNTNTGTGSGTSAAWATVAHALGGTGTASGVTGGDTIYIAPGKYAGLTIAVAPSSTLSVIGDPSSAQFGYTIAPGPVHISNIADRSLSNVSLGITATSKDNITLKYLVIGGISMSACHNLIIDGCHFYPHAGNANPVTFTFTAGVNANTQLLNSSLTAGAFNNPAIAVTFGNHSTSYASSFKMYNIVLNNSRSNASIQITCNNATDIILSNIYGNGNATVTGTVANQAKIINSILQYLTGSTGGNLIEDYNLFMYGFSANRTNVSAGANSFVANNPLIYGDTMAQAGAGAFSSNQPAPTVFNQLIGYGTTTDAPTTDYFGNTYGTPMTIGIAMSATLTGAGVYSATERNASTITIAPGSTSQSIELYLGATGLTASTAGLSARYNRTRTASVSIPLVARTIAQAWTAGGFAEVDATNMPGVYRLDLPDAALAAGADDVTIVVRGASGTNGAVMTVKLSSGGLTEAQTAGAVWNAVRSSYATAGTFGEYVNTNVNTGAIADAVWDEARSGHTTVGTFGQYVNAELVTPVTSAALVRMGPFEVKADGLGASDPLDIQKGAQHGIDIQCVDNNGAGIDITSATVTAKVYNSGATLVDTYSCTATYAADGRATFTIDTTVTNTPGTYTATITRTTGASDTQIFGPLRIYVRDI